MNSHATKEDRFITYGLSKEQFVAAYEIAKLRLKQKNETAGRVTDQDVFSWINVDKDASIISKIKAGHSAREVTEKLLLFINDFAPEELPVVTRNLIDSWAGKEIKSKAG